MQIPLIDDMYTVQEGIIQKCVWNLTPDRCVHLWQSFIENSRNDFMKRYSRQPTASFKGFAQLLSVLMDETHLMDICCLVSPLLRLSPPWRIQRKRDCVLQMVRKVGHSQIQAWVNCMNGAHFNLQNKFSAWPQRKTWSYHEKANCPCSLTQNAIFILSSTTF